MLPERVKLGHHGDYIPFTLSLRQPSRFRSNVSGQGCGQGFQTGQRRNIRIVSGFHRVT